MATPVRSGYSDFGQNWKVRKTCCFCYKLIVFMKEQNIECLRRIGRAFSTFQKINSKWINNKIATSVRSGYNDFGPTWKVPKTCLFFLQTDCFHERTKFWMFQKNWKGIFNISKNHLKKMNRQNKMATPVRSGYRRFWSKLKSPQNMPFFSSNWLFSWKNKILNVSEELEGYFQHFKKYSKSTKKLPHR